jgi:hypothetical protein
LVPVVAACSRNQSSRVSPWCGARTLWPFTRTCTALPSPDAGAAGVRFGVRSCGAVAGGGTVRPSRRAVSMRCTTTGTMSDR